MKKQNKSFTIALLLAMTATSAFLMYETFLMAQAGLIATAQHAGPYITQVTN